MSEDFYTYPPSIWMGSDGGNSTHDTFSSTMLP